MSESVEKLRSEFYEFQKEIVEILSKLAHYNFDRDVLGIERTKSGEILKHLYKLRDKYK